MGHLQLAYQLAFRPFGCMPNVFSLIFLCIFLGGLHSWSQGLQSANACFELEGTLLPAILFVGAQAKKHVTACCASTLKMLNMQNFLGLAEGDDKIGRCP